MKWLKCLPYTLILLLSINCYADTANLTKVEIAPLVTKIETTELYTIGGGEYTTCPTVVLRGRREITIRNRDTTNGCYIFGQGETQDTVGFWLDAGDIITIKAGDDLRLFASSSTAVLLSIMEIK